MSKKIFFPLLMMLFLSAFVQAAGQHSFEIKNGQFVYDGKPARIISGEMHYARIPHQYWRHRMKMLKAMGLNAVATYVFWNFHEPEPGKWDFSGDRNLAEYVKIAGEEGLMVILRPGPYVCAEWEFGGYPWWLQNVEGLELRRDNEQFLKYTKLYMSRLYREVGELQVTKGGPIVMVQAENEFGSYVSQRKDIPLEEHRAYNAKIVQQLKDVGFDVPTFTSDGSWLFEGGSVPGALPTANGESNIDNLKKVVNRYNGGQGPYMVAEFYPGWLAHWLEPHPQVKASGIARQTEKYLRNDVSFNFYMAHGGTNFGFTGGANYDEKHGIQPDLTSYDYDAPISEAGWATPKFDSIRSVVKRYVKYPLPEAPARIPVIEIPSIRLDKLAGLFHAADGKATAESDRPMTFEELGQGYGYVLYKRHFNQPISGTLAVEGLRDYALVYVNGEKVGELNRYFNKYTLEVDVPFNGTLEILVENMGRINYGSEIIHNRKGIISPVKIGDSAIEGGWEMYGLPMDKAPDLNKLPAASVLDSTDAHAKALAGKPAIYSGTFDLTETGDTFLNMEDWGKGIVFVNGVNIGRYWSAGPQQTLYLPGAWLKKGANEIVIFEQQNDKPHKAVSTTRTPVLTKLKAQK
ncbi:MAG: beta-galactosidase [Prevotellaceae bacterium]|nr:beta-galactosidase [Prevotellaceae bacterium]